jgi:hypothetical protein
MKNFWLELIWTQKSGGIAELASASIVCPRHPGLNLGVDVIFSDFICVGIKFKFARPLLLSIIFKYMSLY